MRSSACSCPLSTAPRFVQRMLCVCCLPLTYSLIRVAYCHIQHLDFLRACRQKHQETLVSETLSSASARLRIFLGQKSIAWRLCSKSCTEQGLPPVFLQKQQAWVKTASTQRSVPSCLPVPGGPKRKQNFQWKSTDSQHLLLSRSWCLQSPGTPCHYMAQHVHHHPLSCSWI